MHTDGRSEVIVANPPYAQSKEGEENRYLKKRVADLEKQLESQEKIIDTLRSMLEKIAK